MQIATRNCDGVGQARRRRGLTVEVETPADDRAIGAQGQAVIVTGGDGPYAVESRRNGSLPQSVVAPSGHRAAGKQRETVGVTRRNGDDVVRSARRDGALIEIVATPPERGTA